MLDYLSIHKSACGCVFVTASGSVLKAVNYNRKAIIIEEVQLFKHFEPVKVLRLSTTMVSPRTHLQSVFPPEAAAWVNWQKLFLNMGAYSGTDLLLTWIVISGWVWGWINTGVACCCCSPEYLKGKKHTHQTTSGDFFFPFYVYE